jgi:DNA replication protein DnaC
MNGFVELLDSIAEQTEPKRNTEDYEKDGLLYCGKCNTPKQTIVQVCGKVMKPYCMCECEEKAFKAEQERTREILRKEEIERNRSNGFLDLDMIGCRFSADDRKNAKVSEISQRYVKFFRTMLIKGKGLLYYGGTGTGKSFMAACIANALTDAGYKCLVTNFPRIINELTGLFEGKQAYINDLNRYDLLVIDDLAIERDTEYTAEIIQNVIDSRYRSKKPLIVTTNLSIEEIMNPKGIRKQRLFSRLKEMCLPIAVTGEDRRDKKFEDNYNAISKLLGI